jgi:hypothetical protein
LDQHRVEGSEYSLEDMVDGLVDSPEVT